ncbi:MAG: helix-hairpin-helix domain-containing protein [Cyclobacteriaceae bacterium]|nr:helix-hairpin-helix domain-containing protein [Cyclobacteriaceae bacterium]
MKSKILILLFAVLSIRGLAQQVTQPVDIEKHIAQILMNKGEEADNQSYYELLLQFYNNPIPINTCQPQDLWALQLLTTEQVKDIMDYRKMYGEFKNKYELMAVSSLSIDKIKEILPFLSFNTPISLTTILKQSVTGKDNFLLGSTSQVLEPSNGFLEDKYFGDPYQYSLRLRIMNPGHTSLGLTLQKDPGELAFRADSLYTGPDFYSFHFYIQNQGRIKQLALGDYKLQFGQGLVLGAGFLAGKNASSITSLQATLKVQPYTSLTEYNYFRGAGTTIEIIKNLEVSVFYSNQLKDASVYSTDSLDTEVTSLRTDGLHRTLSELTAQNSIREQVAGAAITYSKGAGEIGIIGLYNSFNIPFSPKPTIYNLYKFSGKENYNVSVFGRYTFQNVTLYGEAAHTLHHGSAINLGIVSSLSKNIDFTFQYRYLAPDFHSFYGLTFAESSTLSNEKGAYWGMNIRISSSLTLTGYFDMYRFPWLKSSLPKPGLGNDGLVRLNYKYHKSALFYLQIQNEQNDRKISDAIVQQAMAHKTTKYILNLDYNLENPISFRTRLQWTISKFETEETGVLIYQDINLSLRKISLSGRYSIFDTDGYLSRQYMYEKDVLYAFSTPQFSGRGVRYYLLVKYAPIKPLALRAKWSQTIYYDRSSIGSGNSEINGNTKSQFTLQLKYDF